LVLHLKNLANHRWETASSQQKNEPCVSKVIMSPLTATLKCPHGDGKHTHGAEAVAEVAFDQDGGR
jgi:hypothetical protein